MDGDDVLGCQELDRPQGIVGPHGEVVADRNDGQIQAFLADQAHIAEQAGIASHVNFLFVVGGEQEPGGVAAVFAIGQP